MLTAILVTLAVFAALIVVVIGCALAGIGAFVVGAVLSLVYTGAAAAPLLDDPYHA